MKSNFYTFSLWSILFGHLISLKDIMMNVIKSLLAVAVLAISVNASAQIVFIPDFPVKKAVETVNAEQNVPAAKAVAQGTSTVKKAPTAKKAA
jgi:uncharacterized membrane protein YccF (DUF307 family)